MRSAAILALLISWFAFGQSFEVASIKLHVLPVQSIGVSISGARVTVTAMSVTNLIEWAYDLKSYQISAGPGWTNDEHWDIAAKAGSEGILTKDEAKKMMQALLADRFQVKVSRKMRETSVYGLVTGKNAPKFK